MSTKRMLIRKYCTKSGSIKTYEYPDDSILISELSYAERDEFRNNLKSFIENNMDILLNIDSRKINKFIRDNLGKDYNVHYVNLYIKKIREKIKKIKTKSDINEKFNHIKRKFNELSSNEQNDLLQTLLEIVKLNQN